jgi:protein SCO1
VNEKTSRVALVLGAFLAGLVLFFTAILLVTGYAPSPVGQAVAAVGGPFQLTDQSGKAVTDADMKGKPFLVFFGFTHCPDICPTTLFDMSQLMKELGSDADRTGALFITVDPERDTPKLMQEYVSSFNSAIIGLSGSRQAIDAAEKTFRVFARKGESQADGDYSMDHSSIIYLMDKNGAFIEAFNVERPPKDAAKDLERFL